MDAPGARFECPSSPLEVRPLLARARASFWLSIAASLLVHLSLARVRAIQAEQKTAKPLTTQFVKRQPRLTKPLELKKRPQPKRRQVRREMVAVKARRNVDQGRVSFQPAHALGGLAKPAVRIGRAALFDAAGSAPATASDIIESTKEVEQKIDLSLELLDINALNTGRYHAMVVQDVTDKRNLKGFCRLSCLYIPRLHDRALPHMGGRGTTWFNHYVAGCVRHLVGAMNEYTAVETRVGERVTIDNPELFRMPWVFHTYFYQAYRLSDGELEILGRYLGQGGFIFADAHPFEECSVAASHAENLLAALETAGIRSVFTILPADHPIYHWYFDFSMPPPGADALLGRYKEYPAERTLYLEGLHVENRLVAILSKKGYYSAWAEWGAFAGLSGYPDMDPARQVQFGVNLIVFALTQEGSITRRLMDAVR